MTDWSIFGGNPAPGSPDVFEGVARALGPIVETGQSSSDSLRAMARQAGSALWTGNAADAFVASVHVLPTDLGELVSAHQDAISALNDYASALSVLQQQAAQALTRAQTAQSSADSASARRASAVASYNAAEEQYLLYLGKVDVLEIERAAALTAGDLAAATRIELEINSATQARNAAWAARSAAAADIQSAQADLNAAQGSMANEQANARALATDRVSAAELLRGRLQQAAEMTIGARSWVDRVSHEFESVGEHAWTEIASVTSPGHVWGGIPAHIMSISNSWGWLFGAAISQVPKMGTVTAIASAADGIVRVSQDIHSGHYQVAYETGSDTVGSGLIGLAGTAVTKGAPEAAPYLALAGLNVLIWSSTEQAARSVDWSEAVHDPSSINPFQPGGPSAIWQAEKTGFTSLGESVVGALGSL